MSCKQIAGRSVLLLGMALVLCVGFLGAARAQSLSGLKLGDDIAAAKAFGAFTFVRLDKDYELRAWNLASGNQLTVGAKADGKIGYIEMSWGRLTTDENVGLFDFVFGATTLAEIRQKLGSTGMAFNRRPSIRQERAGVVLLNSYEVGSAIVTFYTAIAEQDFDKELAAEAESDAGRYARLNAVSLADKAYAESVWGDPSYDTAYKKLEMQ